YPKVSRLVATGILFGWQRDPGKPGSRLRLSERQVWRYANDPERLARRERAIAAREGSGDAEKERPLWPRIETRFEWIADAKDWRGTSKQTEKDYGEFFSSRQAGRILGICRGSLKSLRVRGRLKGYQRSRRNGAGQKWWFYLKQDVYSLQGDKQY